MKNIYYFFILSAFPFLLAGCYADNGNYTYQPEDEIMPVSIGELSSRSVPLGGRLQITPEVTGLEEGVEYIYSWYTTKKGTTNLLSSERNLDITVNLEVEGYTLWYSIENPNNGIKTFQSLFLTVTSDFSGGWFILKDEDGYTDVDFLNMKGEIVSDLISGTGRLEGNARSIVYQGTNYGHTFEDEEGIKSVWQLPVIHVLSDREIKTYREEDFLLLKDENSFFYNKPDVIRPQVYTWLSALSNLLINDGKLHGIYNGMQDNFSKMGDLRPYQYGSPAVTTTDYELTDMMLMNSSGHFLGFEKTTSSFVYSGYVDAKVIPKAATTGLPLVDLNYEFINYVMRVRGRTNPSAFVLMREKDTREYAVFAMVNGTSGNPLREIIPIPASSKLLNYTIMAADPLNQNIFYAEGDNILRNHLLTTAAVERESVLYTFPANETITAIDYDSSTNSQLFCVTTFDGQKWKFYAFQRVGDTTTLQPEPLFVFEGMAGTARFILPRSININ